LPTAGGLKPARHTPPTALQYDFFLEREYPSLEALAAETQARDADYEFSRLMRATYPCVVQGSIVIEIYESVDPGKVS
jgi:hypothetical protein